MAHMFTHCHRPILWKHFCASTVKAAGFQSIRDLFFRTKEPGTGCFAQNSPIFSLWTDNVSILKLKLQLVKERWIYFPVLYRDAPLLLHLMDGNDHNRHRYVCTQKYTNKQTHNNCWCYHRTSLFSVALACQPFPPPRDRFLPKSTSTQLVISLLNISSVFWWVSTTKWFAFTPTILQNHTDYISL